VFSDQTVGRRARRVVLDEPREVEGIRRHRLALAEGGEVGVDLSRKIRRTDFETFVDAAVGLDGPAADVVAAVPIVAKEVVAARVALRGARPATFSQHSEQTKMKVRSTNKGSR